jgi:hypothetical protein
MLAGHQPGEIFRLDEGRRQGRSPAEQPLIALEHLGVPELVLGKLFDHLTCPKTFLQFTEEEGADEHCQAGAQRLAMARVCNWLDAPWVSRASSLAPATRNGRAAQLARAMPPRQLRDTTPGRAFAP